MARNWKDSKAKVTKGKLMMQVVFSGKNIISYVLPLLIMDNAEVILSTNGENTSFTSTEIKFFFQCQCHLVSISFQR